MVNELVALLLAWPRKVSLFVSEATSRHEIRLRSSADLNVCTKVSRIFAQAFPGDVPEAGHWKLVSASSCNVRVKGCISSQPAASRQWQVVTIGVHPVMNNDGSNVLIAAVNDVFHESDFGQSDGKKRGSNGQPAAKRRKPLERWPAFFLQVTMPAADFLPLEDYMNGTHFTIQRIISLLRHVACRFLEEENLRPRALSSARSKPSSIARLANSSSRRRKRQPQPETHTSISSQRPNDRAAGIEARTMTNPFEGWHRVKVGLARPRSKFCNFERSRQSSQDGELPAPLVGEGGRLLRRPFDDSPAEDRLVDTALFFSQKFEDTEGQEAMTNEMSAISKAIGELRDIRRKTKPFPSVWLDEVLRTWENPVFETKQMLPRQIGDGDLEHAPAHCPGYAVRINFEAGSLTQSSRLSRAALARARIISQVDRKFIFVELDLHSSAKANDTASTSALVLIDQHAADERCKLEELMASHMSEDVSTGTLKAVIEPLERPAVFEVSAQEGELLQRCQTHFETWGVLYHVARAATLEAACASRVVVKGLSPSIAERCVSEPRLLIDLLRQEAWTLEEGSKPIRGEKMACRAAASAPSLFRGCPSGILELLHSRSCRSAIMFNDALSVEECERLIAALSRCAFPFQCAHGRPSMVPVVDLGRGPGLVGGWREEASVGLVGWKRWMDDAR